VVARSAIERQCAQVLRGIDQLKPEGRQTILRTLVDQVVVRGRLLEIHGILPRMDPPGINHNVFSQTGRFQTLATSSLFHSGAADKSTVSVSTAGSTRLPGAQITSRECSHRSPVFVAEGSGPAATLSAILEPRWKRTATPKPPLPDWSKPSGRLAPNGFPNKR